ncbi:NPA1P-like protein, partial [Mya arenaria]
MAASMGSMDDTKTSQKKSRKRPSDVPEVKTNDESKKKKTSFSLQLVFLALEKILLRIADDLGKYYNTGQTIVRKLLTAHANILHNVVMNPAISKTAKVQVFTEKTLKELCHLYSWQGPAKWKQSLGAKQSDSQEPQTETVMRDEDGMVAMETVTQFLTELCSSYKNGIIFHDKTYGLSGRNQNHLMTAVLSSLLPHCNQSVVCSLVTDILTACPDQLHRFMQSLAPTLSPREASKWVTSLNFLVKVYRSLQDSVRVLKIKDVKTAEQLVNILLVYTFPPQHVLTTVFPGIRTLPDVMSVFGCWDKMTSATSTESKATELQKLYELSSVDVAGFRQEVVQTLCLYQENVAGHTLLYQLLEISTSLIDTSDLSESVLELVCKLLETTGQFDGHHDELLLWLRTIRQFGQGVQESVSKCGQGVLEFVSRVMMTYIHNPYPYMDTVCDIQSSVAMETESANGQSVDIEDIEKMDGIPLESDDFEDSPEPTKRFNFCPMLLVAMETAQKEENLDNDVSAKTLQTLWQVPDKLMSDGLVVPLHTTAKTEVSQALLKLSLLVGCINKKNEKVVLDEMEKVMDALLAETKKTTEQLDSVNCVTTTSSGLENVSKETTGKQHIRCVKMVLDHHVIKEYFLADLNETKSPKAKISKCVSSFVATLFSMTDMFGKDMQEIFGFYSEKCEQILSSGEDVKNLELIVKIAHILGKALPTEKCVQFLNLVICFSLRGKSKMSSGDSSSSMMCLVDTLLGRIRGSSLKIVKLTEESFNNLLNLFLEDDQSKLLALCSFVARFPSLAVLCMEDKVESLVSSEDGINLLKMLMRNNMALTMKVCDLVNQGHLDVRENLGLLDLCLQQLKGKAYLKGSKMLTSLKKKIQALFEGESEILPRYVDLVKLLLGDSELKGCLVDLLTTLIDLNPSSCQTDHVGVLLGAYGASLSLTDQNILKLMQFYEKNEIPFSNFKPFIWGEKGIELYSLRRSLGPSLKQPGLAEVLSLHREERQWILSLMVDGLRETADYRIFEKRFAFKMLLGVFDSCLSDYSMQKKSEMKDTVDVDEKNDRTYMEVDGDVDDTASGSDSTLNDEEKIVVETLMKIVLLWKKTSDIATGKASLLVDVIVLRWMLNVANSVKELDGGIIDEVVSVIDEKMLSDT